MPKAEQGDQPSTADPLPRVRDAGEPLPRVRDLRGREVRVLKFPARGVVLLAGIPGAGKTTLLRRLYALSGRETEPVWMAGGPVILDSEQARNRWRGLLRPIPYRYWRPLVHLHHYLRLWGAVARAAGPVVVHECGTRKWLIRAVTRHAVRHGRQVHAVLLDVPAPVAGESQRRRGRRVHARRFARHARKWRRIIVAAEHGRVLLPGIATVTLIDRLAADRVRTLDFHELPTTPTTAAVSATGDWHGHPRR